MKFDTNITTNRTKWISKTDIILIVNGPNEPYKIEYDIDVIYFPNKTQTIVIHYRLYSDTTGKEVIIQY